MVDIWLLARFFNLCLGWQLGVVVPNHGWLVAILDPVVPCCLFYDYCDLTARTMATLVKLIEIDMATARLHYVLHHTAVVSSFTIHSLPANKDHSMSNESPCRNEPSSWLSKLVPLRALH